jgi:hypothetical protein
VYAFPSYSSIGQNAFKMKANQGWWVWQVTY